MAKAKTLTQQELYEIVSNQSTTEQIELKQFIEKILEEKKFKAAEELDLINGKQ